MTDRLNPLAPVTAMIGWALPGRPVILMVRRVADSWVFQKATQVPVSRARARMPLTHQTRLRFMIMRSPFTAPGVMRDTPQQSEEY
ncbi:hypothetical protein DJ64_13160 [Streptomyces griseorubens]|uniref:Uncharacterized protein n=1 Tax=Streptomyces griseorubens TaxID=66897 RepID=A0ABR4SYA3_9ACTN|nr:hypothetical protein DJ64_13160 [Streptomyces griseorubens]